MRATLDHVRNGIEIFKAQDGRELVAVQTIAGPMWIDACDYFRFCPGAPVENRSTLEAAERDWARGEGQ